MKRGMKRWALGLASLCLGSGSLSALADPEQERQKLATYYQARFPDIKPEDYIHGALAFEPDAMAQYRSIMEFPPFAGQMEKAERMWKTPFNSGKTYADCLPNGGHMIAGDYPRFDGAKGRVVTLEDLVNECRAANGEEAYTPGDPRTMGLLSVYLRALSNGMKMNIKVEGEGARKAFEDGKKSFYQRVGQLNFSCASCHVDNAGVRLRSEILSPAIGQATHWPVFRGGDQLVTLQGRFESCYRDIRHVPEAPGSARFNNLEYYLSYLSNGLALQSGVFRK
jgi:sulfur-oxidizing protein SoxA